MPTQVMLPHLGESIVEGMIGQWLKHEGNHVTESEPLVEVTTDKVNVEIPSPASGVLLKTLVAEGETTQVGSIIAWIGEPGEAIPEHGEQVAPAVASTTAQTKSDQTMPCTKPRHDQGFISPAVSRLAREHGIDLNLIEGTGNEGRITKQDVLAYLKRRDQVPPVAVPQPGLITSKPATGRPVSHTSPTYVPGKLVVHTPMRRAIAEHMVRSKRNSPHVTSVMEADLSRVVLHRQAKKQAFERKGLRLTFTAYFVATSAQALVDHPFVNSSRREEGIFLHANVNVGVATSLDDAGLIVPVIKGADQLSLMGIAASINDLVTRARRSQLSPDEVREGTFTITNYGVNGPLFGTPVINQPQCAIMGIGLIQKRAVVRDDAIAIRPMVYLTLTFDHRILDGATADRFLSDVVRKLENWT